MLAVLRALAGREVAIVGDPPALVFDAPDLDAAAAAARSRPGPRRRPAGREGTWAGLLGRAGSPAASTSRPARSGSPDGSVVAVPIGDLERFV